MVVMGVRKFVSSTANFQNDLWNQMLALRYDI